MSINAILIDARNVGRMLPIIEAELATAEVTGFDIETQDVDRHEGLNVYNTATRLVFDHRRTVITGFSTYVEGSDTAYYFNMAHADVKNRLPADFGRLLISKFNPNGIRVAHNAPFELVMVHQCWGVDLQDVVCTLQMAVSHHGPDEYDINTFYQTPIPESFWKFGKQIIDVFSEFERGGSTNNRQQELLGKFIGKTSKADHSWNGMVKKIAKGYNLKQLTKSRFGVEQTTFKDLLSGYSAKHTGELTGEQIVAYGADDAYWAVMHYRWMFDDMLANNPKALQVFFRTENPMVQMYADAWREGIRLDLKQVFSRRDIERHDMAELLRGFKAKLAAALPFDDEPNEQLMKREKWYREKDGWKRKRKQLVDWIASPNSPDDFEQAFQVSNPIGNAWAAEKGKAVPAGKLNIIYYATMRTIMYDLLGLPLQFEEGKVASDGDARGRLREMFGPEDDIAAQIMTDIQKMAEIEQRVKLYLTPYTQLMDPETSRVYPSLSSQLATRRLATSFPNPMQLAKTGESAYIRSFYLGDDDDSVVVSADWSAIELVLIGDQSNGSSFRRIYGQLPYGDMHVGSAVDALSIKTMPGLTEEEFKEFKFGRNPNNRVMKNFAGVDLSPSDYYKWARGTPIGKGINFGYWYSGAVSGVANDLGLSDTQHWELVDKYRSRHPEEEAWRIGVQDEAAINGYVILPDGHRRNRFEATVPWAQAMKQKFADISVAHGMLAYGDLAVKRLQGRARNQVVNSVIQGTCATLAKRTLLNLKTLCENAGLGWGKEIRMMFPVHDELVFSVHKSQLLSFIPLFRQAMTTHPDLVKNLPLDCTVAIGRTFRPFDKQYPWLSQIELDEAQMIEGVIGKDLEGSKLSDDKVAELLDWMFIPRADG
jgi:DNA polymerase I-like protein with 3'-5' exonuclease and polymerase domains